LKKHTSEWPASYTPSQKLGSVFAGLDSSTRNKTLAEALDGKAGANNDMKNLLKQAVSGVLNAATANIKYPFTEDQVIDAVNIAIASGKSAQNSLATLLDDANNNEDCNKPPGGGGTENCDTDGKPNVLLLQYNGQSCAEAFNSQMAISGKTSCSGDPADAPVVRIVASTSSTPPAAGSAKFFDGLVNLSQTFEVRASNAGTDRFGSNTYFHLYNGTTLVQTIQLHTSCSAPLVRGETFGSLVLVDYSIAP